MKCSTISVRLRINSLLRSQISTSISGAVAGEKDGCWDNLSLTTSLYLYFYLFLSFIFFIYFLYSYLMENQNSKSIHESAIPLATDLLPWESSQPIQTSQYRLSSRLIAMIQNLSFHERKTKTLTFILEILSKHVIVFALKAFLIKLYVGSYFLFL